MRVALGGIALVLLLAGCGSDDDSEPEASKESSDTPSVVESSEPAEETSSAAPAPITYNSVVKLRDAAIAAGYKCDDWEQTDVVNLAAESGSCSPDDVFATYASQADLDEQVRTKRELDKQFAAEGIKPSPTIVGTNWTITGDDAVDIADELGGTVSK